MNASLPKRLAVLAVAAVVALLSVAQVTAEETTTNSVPGKCNECDYKVVLDPPVTNTVVFGDCCACTPGHTLELVVDCCSNPAAIKLEQYAPITEPCDPAAPTYTVIYPFEVSCEENACPTNQSKIATNPVGESTNTLSYTTNSLSYTYTRLCEGDGDCADGTCGDSDAAGQSNSSVSGSGGPGPVGPVTKAVALKRTSDGGKDGSYSPTMQTFDLGLLPGEETAPVGSAIQTFSLGRAPDGKGTGWVQLPVDIESGSVKAGALVPLVRPVADVVYEPGTNTPQVLRQVMAAECLLVVNTNAYAGYELRFYHARDIEPELDEDGFYHTKIMAPPVSPFASYSVRQVGDTLAVSGGLDGDSSTNVFAWSAANNQWTLTRSGTVSETVATKGTPSLYTVTRTLATPDGAPASVTAETRAVTNDVTRLISSVRDPDGAALETRRHFTPVGRLELATYPDGSWTRYSHDTRGRTVLEVTPLGDATPEADLSLCQVVSNSYTSVDARDTDADEWFTRPRIITEYVAGVPVARTYRVHYRTAGEEEVEIEERAASLDAPYGDPANLRTKRTWHAKHEFEPWSEKIRYVDRPGDLRETYVYESGTFDASASDPAAWSFTPVTTGLWVRAITDHGTMDSPGGIAFRSRRDISIRDPFGRPLLAETWLCTGETNTTRIAWVATTRNDLGQTVATYSSDGSQTETTWGCCGPAFETAADGTTTTTTYDALQRPILSDRDGEDHNLYTETAYDAAGRTTYRRTFAGDLAQSTTNVYDLAGRLTWSRGPDGIETAYSYASNATTTIRGGLTNLSVRFADGRAHYSEQNGLRQQTYAYGLDASSPGCQTTTVFSGPDGADSSAWSKTVSDPLGRTIAQIRPGFPSGAGVPPALLVTSNSYNSVGHLVRTERRVSDVESRLLDVTLFTYDSLGQPLLTCEDLNLDGEIDLAGPDRVSGRSTRTIQLADDYWHESASWTYPATGSATPLTNAIARTRLTGLGSSYAADGASGILSAESVSIDARGNETVSRTVIDRGNKTVYRLTDTPHSTVAALSTTVNGRLLSSRSTSGLVTSYTYDALGRQIATQDARGGIQSRGYDALGRVAWETDPATNGTWYAYDNLGRRIAVTNALGEVTHSEYDAEGRILKTYGATYPVAYGYDAFGRMVSMKTFRDEQGAGDETRWFYEEATGLLTNKVYADGKGTAYSYTADGKLASRAWARGVTTSYAYTNGSSLVGIDYSDATPAVTFQYDRLGRMATAIVAGVSTNLFTYDGFDLVSETQNGVVISRETDVLGRPVGFALDEDYAVTYAYDMFGRFHSVSSSVQSAQSVVEYTRLANSELLSGRSLEIGNSLLAVGYSYEPARSLVTSVENSFDSSVVSRYDYANDELGRRTHIERSGLAFGDLPVQDAYGYNPRSEVTSARRTPIGSQTELRGFSYDYEYDPIGNRITSTEYDHEGNALESEYTANALNQYGQRTVPGYAGVRGEANTNAVVTVNANPAWRYGEYFYGGDAEDNTVSAAMKQLEITAVQSNLFTAVTGRVFVAETPEAFAYDDDGNLTQDGRFGYTWNAENRLIKAETRDDLPVAMPRVKVEYAYDHQGRRVAAATSAWTNDAWQAVESRAFFYDGWNVVTELTHSQTHTLTNSYVWGLDLSGTRQSAGGIGGLLAANFVGTTALYCYDANGNVGQLVGTDGELLAHYEYSPFGETVVATGPLAKTNPFRFSTKWFDGATGLGDWGYRRYSPSMGRWLSKDPIGEKGCVNVYVYTKNSCIDEYDYLGLFGYTKNKTPTLGDCGMFRTFWDYFGLPGKGWIIQHVKRTFTIEKIKKEECCVAIKDPQEVVDDEWWEAFWYSGEKDANNIEKRDLTSGHYYGSGTKGKFINAKRAIWYGMLELDTGNECPKGFRKPIQQEQHAGACIREKEPTDWDEKYDSESSVSLRWIATWDCCEGSDPKTKLSYGF